MTRRRTGPAGARMIGLVDRLAGGFSPSAALRRAQRLIEEGKRAEAMPLLARAANARIAEAEYLVGRAYLEAGGVPPSPVEAARWLERAAQQGYEHCRVRLAHILS